MKTQLWIDGYNVIFASEPMAALARQDIHAARHQLIGQVAEYAGAQHYEPIVFFDDRTSSSSVQEEELLGVRTITGNHILSADSLMEKMNFETDRTQNIVLVTSDNLLKTMIGHRTSSSRIIEARDFSRELLATRAQALTHTQPRQQRFSIADRITGLAKDMLEHIRQGK